MKRIFIYIINPLWCALVTIYIAVSETWRRSIDVLFRVPVDVNPVDDPLQCARFLSSLQLWQHRASGFQSASWGRLQEIGYRAHRNIAAGGLFNISAATFGSPLGRPRPLPCRFTGPWSLPLTEPAAYNLPGFPPIPPQLILWDGIVMQIKDA